MHTRKPLVFFIAVLTAAAVTGCAGSAAPTPTQAPPTDSPAATPTAQPVSGLDALIDALSAAGATVERGDTVSQPFFEPTGQIVKVNGADVQVFEYPDAASAESAASTISADGSSIGTTIVTWVDTPHFYRKDNLIVLYVGRDVGVIDLLTGALGSPIAEGPAMLGGPVEALMAALNARDWAAIQAQMGESFIIGYWRSEGVTYTAPAAVQQLLPGLLPASGELSFTTDESQFPSLDGIPFASMWGPDVEIAHAIFSQGWGSDGKAEAILALVERADGSTVWHGMLFAGMGFD